MRTMRFWLALVIMGLAWPALADITITPTRVVMEPGTRDAVVTLRNPSDRERVYRVSWAEREMTADGSVEPRAEPGPFAASPHVRIAPRRVAVGPGQTQTVRLHLRPPADLPPGEYRSHLVLGLEPESEASFIMGQEETPAEGVGFRLEALLSFALPVIFRHGEGGEPQVAISHVEPRTFESRRGTEFGLLVSLEREGAWSSFGRVVAYQQVDQNAPVQEIGYARDVAIYAEANQSRVMVPLRPDVTLQPGAWLRVTYEHQGQRFGQVMAERVFQMAP